MGQVTLLIERENGSTWEPVEAVVTFNDGYSHFVEDGGCYLLVNGHPAPKTVKLSNHLFPEAVDELMKLRSFKENNMQELETIDPVIAGRATTGQNLYDLSCENESLSSQVARNLRLLFHALDIDHDNDEDVKARGTRYNGIKGHVDVSNQCLQECLEHLGLIHEALGGDVVEQQVKVYKREKGCSRGISPPS